MSKQKLREQVIKLRRNGKSINSISTLLGISKSTVSLWVRDIPLTSVQIYQLKLNSHTPEVIEKRRQSRLNNERLKRTELINRASREIGKISKRELWLIGVMLYWAEGGKTQRLVRFSNGDPEMIKIMMKFFRVVCKVENSKFRGYIHIHPTLSVTEAENYWSNVSGITKSQFFKTYNKKNVSSKNKRKSLPHGVMDIYVLDTLLFLKIQGWADGIFEVS